MVNLPICYLSYLFYRITYLLLWRIHFTCVWNTLRIQLEYKEDLSMEKIGQIARRKKDHVITIRLTLRDVMILNKVANYLEMDRSDLVRMYIRKNNNYYGNMMIQRPNNLDINTDYYKWGYTPQDTEDKK